MKKLLLTTVLAVATIVAMANPIGRSAAMQKAQDFMRGINPQAQLQAGTTPRKAMGNNGSPAYYIFNADNNQGFVIVSGDDRSEEILGYSDSGTFDVENMPDALSEMLNCFVLELQDLDEAGITETAATAKARAPRKMISTKREPIAPMTKSLWTQGKPFNLGLENDRRKDGTLPPIGCGICALAQMMYFWQYADMRNTTIPAYSMTTDAYDGTHTTKALEPMTFDFSKLQNRYSSSSTDTYIGTFCKYIIYAMGSTFWSDGTSTYKDRVKDRMSKYFNYKMNYVPRANITVSEFEDFTYNDLRQGLPVLMEGDNDYTGHFFIADGYSYDDFFHFNWGWDGLCNGYFRLSPLSCHNYTTPHAYSKILTGYFGFFPNDGRLQDYRTYETEANYKTDIITLSFCDGTKDETNDAANHDVQIYTAQSVARSANGTFNFDEKLKIRAYLENRTDLEGVYNGVPGELKIRIFNTDFAILDKDYNQIGTFSAKNAEIATNGKLVVYHNLQNINLPQGDGEYYFVHRSKANVVKDGIFHYSEAKGVYDHLKAVVKNDVLTLSLVPTVEFDLSKTEIIGQCAQGWRTGVRFYAKNNSFNKVMRNYTLYLNSTSGDATYMQDNKELDLQAKSSGYIEMDFDPGTKNGTLYLVDKDRYNRVDVKYNFTLKTEQTPNLKYEWVAENTGATDSYSNVYLYGNELRGYIKITNKDETKEYQDVFTLMSKLGVAAYSGAGKYVCKVYPVKIPAKGSVYLSLEEINYSDLFDIYGEGLPSGQIISLTLCNGKGTGYSNVVSEKSYLVAPGIMWWDKNGKMTAVKASTSAYSVPNEAVAVSFVQSKTMSVSYSWGGTIRNVSYSWAIPSTITVNSNPNCIYYFSSDYSSRLKNANGQTATGKNVVINGSANNINFSDGGGAYVPITFKVTGKVQYTRNFDYGYEGDNDHQGWSTICLPFTVQKVYNTEQEMDVDWYHAAGEKGKNFWLRQFRAEEFRTLYYDYTDVFEANVPYIICMPGEYYKKWGDKWCLTGKDIIFSAENTQVKAGLAIVDCNNYNLMGTTTATKYNPKKYLYGMDTPGNRYDYLSGTVESYDGFKPFRAYLTAESAPSNETQAHVKIAQYVDFDNIEPEDEELITGIETIRESHNADKAIYNMYGVKMQGDLNSLPRGMYIIGGKKYIKN